MYIPNIQIKKRRANRTHIMLKYKGRSIKIKTVKSKKAAHKWLSQIRKKL